MKKSGIMNREISAAVAGMGHRDELMVCGSAFPIPNSAVRIDLGLEPGLPAFMDVVRVICKELNIEKIIVAEETKEQSPARFKEITSFFEGIDWLLSMWKSANCTNTTDN